MSETKLIFLYDGACAICEAEAARLRLWNRGRNTLVFVDISTPGFEAGTYGRTLDELMGRVHAIRADGSVLVGMDAIRAAYGEVGLGWLLAPTRWPGLRSAFDGLYRWFARNRYRISTLAGYCGDRCRLR